MTALAQKLLAFYDREGRQLPWRGVRDLYAIWVSEVMLQQTGVVTVLSYYQPFLERFPTVHHLALAEEEAVLGQWQGLGYYRRARHLHRAAGLIMANGGNLPESLADWVALPGVGPSTAAAILAIGRDQPHTIFDGNVKRVLARLMALPHPLTRAIGRRQVWALAQSLTPTHRPGDYAQAIMDLGATVCTRICPTCQQCPWRIHCHAFARSEPTAFPIQVVRLPKPRRFQWSLLLRDAQERLLLCQRPSDGLLAGLWEPLASPFATSDLQPLEGRQLAPYLLNRFGLKTTHPTSLPTVRHTFTHFHLTVYPFQCHWAGGAVKPDGYQRCRWVAGHEISSLPLATLHRKILSRISLR